MNSQGPAIVLSEEAIRKRCIDANTFNQGVDLFNAGQVLELEEMLSHNSFHAETRDEGEIYDQAMDFNKFGILDRGRCSCPDNSAYPGHCRHLVAALLTLKEYLVEDPDLPDRDSEEIRQVIDSFQEIYRQPTRQEELDLEFNFQSVQASQRDRAKFYLSLRMGTDRLYVVQDLLGLLRAIYEGQDFEINKNLSYQASKHCFATKEQKLIDILLRLYEYELEMAGSGRIFANKSILLSPSWALEILDLLVADYINISIDEHVYKDVPVFEADLPLELKLIEGAGGLELISGIKEPIIPLLAKGRAYFYQGMVYLISPEQNRLIHPLLPRFNQNEDRKIKIPASQAQAFVAAVVRELVENVDLDIESKLKDKIIKNELKAQVKLDYVDGRLVGDLQFSYGDYQLDPFDRNQPLEDFYLYRDYGQEEKIVNFFADKNFRMHSGQLVMDDDTDLLDFILEDMLELSDLVELAYTEAFKQVSRQREAQLVGKISLRESLNILDVGFDLEGIERENLSAIFAAIKEKKRYYRFDDGSFMLLNEEYNKDLYDFAHMADRMGWDDHDLAKGQLELPIYQALLLEESKLARDQAFETLLAKLKNPQEVDYPLPQGLVGDLRPYQEIGYQWMRMLADYGLGGILADDMGLGKTLQAIAYILSLEPGQQAMVIAPTSLVYNWQSELATFAPGLSSLVVSGSQEERQDQLASLGEARVIISSYPLIRRDIDAYRDMDFAVCILDEAQFLKNHRTQTARSVKEIKAQVFFALTGTPIENSISDLWSIFDIIMPNYFPDLADFMALYTGENYDRLHRHSKPFILRRLKKDLLTELPAKIENKVISVLTKDQKRLYLAYLEETKSEVSKIISADGFARGQIKILALLTRLRQICCHPSLFMENYRGESAKLIQLLEILEEAIAGGHRVLIFSQFSSMLGLIRQEFDRLGYSYFYLDGSVPAADRLAMADKFNAGTNDLFLISLKAGGTGLNLTGADMVILYDLWWNPAVEDQATDRAHRLGQDKLVQVIRLVSQGTIEEKIYELQNEKRRIINEVVQTGETLLTKLSEREIRELLDLS